MDLIQTEEIKTPIKIKYIDCPPRISGIYKIDFINGKSYIGQSKNIKERICQHNKISNEKTAVDRAINKYGKIKEFWILEIIDCKDSRKLDEREKYYIDFYNTRTQNNKGYNVAEGGQTGGYRTRRFNDYEAKCIAEEILSNKYITFETLKNKYNCAITTIQAINQGDSPYNYPEYSYPLRTPNESRAIKGYIPEEILIQIINDLKNTTLSMQKIGEKYNKCRQIISDINIGKKHKLEQYIYPIRNTEKSKENK